MHLFSTANLCGKHDFIHLSVQKDKALQLLNVMRMMIKKGKIQSKQSQFGDLFALL